MWIDTHCHLDAPEFEADRDAVVARARAALVHMLVLPAVEAAHFDRVRGLAHQHGAAYALGIHPLYTDRAAEGDLDRLAQALQAYRDDPRLVAVAAVTLAFMAIGAIDDWRSLTRQTNKGLTARAKLLLQALAATLFLIWAGLGQWLGGADAGDIALPLGWVLPIGLLIWPLGLFVFMAESNATNLTDGLDGLAAGCGAVVFTGMGLQLMLRGHGGDASLAGFCAAMAGCWLGFLAHNRHPARLFMGDTGSLAMGAALSAVALLSNSLWPLLLMGGVFLAESLSVILQVWVFKATKDPATGQGRRLFKMAPLHHHFELGGLGEQTVVIRFWIASLLLVGLGLVLLP